MIVPRIDVNVIAIAKHQFPDRRFRPEGQRKSFAVIRPDAVV